ncbi:EAL domain-containing protein [Pseudomonas chlororaphis subsp. aurantiaca]|nr:diguanylate cyclase [Pseudomonas chlororaphis subsp. aurantiaca PB-St2]QFS58672.1 EAL domain-containing protein [Pseudomonas chlororaphis subsp. aurantiaca]
MHAVAAMDMSVGSTAGEEAADFFARTLEQANDAVVIIDDRNRVVFFNAAAERFWGCQRCEVLGREVGTLVPIPIRSRNDGETGINKIIGTSRDVCITRNDGEERWGAMAISKITLQGRVLYAAFFKDVTQARLKDVEQCLLSMSVDASRSAICIVDADGRLIYINDGLLRLLGYSREELLERSPQMFFVADTPGAAQAGELRLESILSGRPHEACGLVGKRNGQRLWVHVRSAPVFDAKGRIGNIVIVFTDISRSRLPEGRQDQVVGALSQEPPVEREEARQSSRRMALSDALTGLPNRSSLLAEANCSLAEVALEQGELAVLYVDLDRFKQVNEALGHASGDELLQVMAHRLRSVLRESDLVGRLSGDEFVLVLPRMNAARVTTFLERLMPTLGAPVDIAGTAMVPSASVGVSLYPSDGQDMESLLHCADIAMYQAKRTERGGFRFFLEEMGQLAQQRLQLETALRQALTGDGLYLVYQPQIDLRTNGLVGVEALARWEHPSLGTIAPAQFIALAEECGLINYLSQWVLCEACEQLARWRRSGIRVPSISVNLSPINFHNFNLAALIARQLQRCGLQPADLCVEVTEGVFLCRNPTTEQTLQDLHTLGVRLAIDDFGAGYSSLGYLRRLPINELKLDQSFVEELEHDASCRALSEAVIGIGKGLSLRMIAEGIEHAAQRDLLQARGYDVGQGQLFSSPMPARVFGQWFVGWHR